MDRYLKPIDKVKKKKKPPPRPTAATAKKKPPKKSMDFAIDKVKKKKPPPVGRAGKERVKKSNPLFDRTDIVKKAASLASASTTKAVRKGPARKVRKPTTQKLLNEVGAHKKTVAATRAKRKAAAATAGLSTPEKPKVSI